MCVCSTLVNNAKEFLKVILFIEIFNSPAVLCTEGQDQYRCRVLNAEAVSKTFYAKFQWNVKEKHDYVYIGQR